MKELLKKLEQEHAELNSKLVKLRAFVSSEEFNTIISLYHADLLMMQLHAMELYDYALLLRIADKKGENDNEKN